METDSGLGAGLDGGRSRAGRSGVGQAAGQGDREGWGLGDQRGEKYFTDGAEIFRQIPRRRRRRSRFSSHRRTSRRCNFGDDLDIESSFIRYSDTYLSERDAPTMLIVIRGHVHMTSAKFWKF